MILKRIVNVVQVIAIIGAVTFVVLLFANQPEDGTASVDGKADGKVIYEMNCARCHGTNGEGGIGPRLAGVVTTAFPDEKIEIELVESGPAIMPAFSEILSDEEIKAVVEYTRNEL